MTIESTSSESSGGGPVPVPLEKLPWTGNALTVALERR